VENTSDVESDVIFDVNLANLASFGSKFQCRDIAVSALHQLHGEAEIRPSLSLVV